jgi:hypothetical protein
MLGLGYSLACPFYHRPSHNDVCRYYAPRQHGKSKVIQTHIPRVIVVDLAHQGGIICKEGCGTGYDGVRVGIPCGEFAVVVVDHQVDRACARGEIWVR